MRSVPWGHPKNLPVSPKKVLGYPRRRQGRQCAYAHAASVTPSRKVPKFSLTYWLRGRNQLMEALPPRAAYYTTLCRRQKDINSAPNSVREVLPRRRSCVETQRAPSLPLIAPPLGFPRYRAPKGALKRERWKFGSLEVWKFSFYGGASPHILYIPYFFTQGAKRRAAVAVSGEAAERPMEPEAVRAHCCVFAIPIFPGQC